MDGMFASVILQPNFRINFAIVFGDIAWRPETSRKMSIVHGAPNALGPDLSGLRLCPSRSSWPPQRGFRARGWNCTPSSLTQCRRYARGSDWTLDRPVRPQAEKPSSEELVPSSRAPWVAFCPPSLGSAGVKIVALAWCSRELSTCCTVVTPRMLFSHQYSLPPSLAGAAGSALRCEATAGTF
jgi:hypothetical protein